MIKIPSPFTIIVPRHSIYKLGLNMFDQFLSATSKKAKCMVRFLMSFENKQNPAPQVGKNPILGVRSVFDGERLFHLFDVLSVLRIVTIPVRAFYTVLAIFLVGAIQSLSVLSQMFDILIRPFSMAFRFTRLTLSFVVTATKVEVRQRFGLITPFTYFVHIQ